MGGGVGASCCVHLGKHKGCFKDLGVPAYLREHFHLASSNAKQKPAVRECVWFRNSSFNADNMLVASCNKNMHWFLVPDAIKLTLDTNNFCLAPVL